MRLMRRATLPLLALFLAPVASSPGEPRFTVTSRSLATVTVDGGRADGFSVGDRLKVVQGATTIGESRSSPPPSGGLVPGVSSTRPVTG
jgi:hypothetical protein